MGGADGGANAEIGEGNVSPLLTLPPQSVTFPLVPLRHTEDRTRVGAPTRGGSWCNISSLCS